MIFQPLDILGSTKRWNSFLEIFGGPKCGRPSRICVILRHLLQVKEPSTSSIWPLPIPRQSWCSISMDFITNLPSSRNFDVIFVIIDQLTKMALFVPYKKTITKEETARFFVDNVYRYRGLPDDIISNRGPQFVSKFWRSLFEILKENIKLSSVFHPQING
jgi:hypothetical protein